MVLFACVKRECVYVCRGVVVVVVSTILINVLLNKCGGLGIGIGQLFTNCHYHTAFSHLKYLNLFTPTHLELILGRNVGVCSSYKNEKAEKMNWQDQ